MHLKLSFLVLLGDCEKLFLTKKLSKLFTYVFLFLSFYLELVLENLPMSQEYLVVESWQTPRWVTFLIFCRLVYSILSHFNDLILAWSAELQLCQKVYPSKFRTGVWNLLISETGSKFNSVFRPADSNGVIIMELKRKVKYSWTCFFEPVNVSGAIEIYCSLQCSIVVRHNRLSIATDMVSFMSISFF